MDNRTKYLFFGLILPILYPFVMATTLSTYNIDEDIGYKIFIGNLFLSVLIISYFTAKRAEETKTNLAFAIFFFPIGIPYLIFARKREDGEKSHFPKIILSILAMILMGVLFSFLIPKIVLQ